MGPQTPEALRRAAPRGAVAASVALAWAAAAATAAAFVLAGRATDQLGDHAGASPWPLAIGIGAWGLLAALCVGTGAWLSQWAAARTETTLRALVISRVFERGAVTARARAGALLALATSAVERTAQYRAAFIGPIAGALTTPLLVLAIMALTVDAVTAGILALLIVLVPCAIGGFQRLVRPIGGEYRSTQARLTEGFLEAIQALETLVYARAERRAGDDLARRGEDYRRGLMRLLAGNQLLIFVVDAAFSLTVVVAAAAVLTARAAAGELSLGQAIAGMLMTTLVIGPVDVVGQFFYIGAAGRGTQTAIARHLGAAPASMPASAPAGGTSEQGAAMNEADAGSALLLGDVTASWPASRGERPAAPVLREFAMRVGAGEHVALVGPSGAGKSTVSALLQGHLRASAGRVLVDGADAGRDPAAARAALSVVEQRTFLFVGTIAENVRLARPGADDEAVWAALERAGLAAEVRAMPEQLQTQVGAGGALLSGGQMQRLAIARAWLRDAPIVLLDEPTSQVDLAGEQGILDALAELGEGRTVLMIAHRPAAILAADRVITLAPQPPQPPQPRQSPQPPQPPQPTQSPQSNAQRPGGSR